MLLFNFPPHSVTPPSDKIKTATLPVLNADVMMQVFESFAGPPCGRFEDESAQRITAHQLSTFALVCRDWSLQAMAVLWRNLSQGLGHEGFFAPSVIDTLTRCPELASCVRTLHMTATLEGALWQSDAINEGDIFAGIVRLCPNLCDVVVPSFEAACRANVLNALSRAKEMRSFAIRVYLESVRRSSRFSALVPYFDWNLETLTGLFACWPHLESFVVRHIPMEAYHMRPDIVLAPPTMGGTILPPQFPPLTRLELRETFINDEGLFHLLGQCRLVDLCLMSCQGITSSAITKRGLYQAIAGCGNTLKRLQIMTPWLPSEGAPKLVVDDALRSCNVLESLTVAGWDVSDALWDCIPPSCRLEEVGVTDFEAITPAGILAALNRRSGLSNLRRLCIWQRNGGLSANGSRISTGWFQAMFEKHRGPLADALASRGIKVGTGWESRLLSGGSVDYWGCSAPSLRHMPVLAWSSPSYR